MNVVVVEDNPSSMAIISNYLSESHLGIKVVGTAAGVSEAYEVILSSHPDIILLDIELPDGTGFDIIQKLAGVPINVIFITAYDEYAIKAIKYAAIDYLLKPINKVELYSALERARSNKLKNDRFQTLLHNLNESKPKKHRLALATVSGVDLITIENIIRLEAAGVYTKIFLVNGSSMLSSKNLREFELLLDPIDFFRVHRSHIVHLAHIKSYVNSEGGQVLLSDGTLVDVARRRKDMLLELFK